MKKLILPILAVGALFTGFVVIPLVASRIKAGAIEVYQLTPLAPEVVQVNKEMWEFDAPDPKTTPDYDKKLMGVYGLPNETRDKLLFIDRSKVIYPGGLNPDGTPKRPDLALYPVDKQKGENPWQLKTVDFLAAKLRGGSVIVSVAFLALFLLLRLGAPAAPGRSPAAGH